MRVACCSSGQVSWLKQPCPARSACLTLCIATPCLVVGTCFTCSYVYQHDNMHRPAIGKMAPTSRHCTPLLHTHTSESIECICSNGRTCAQESLSSHSPSVSLNLLDAFDILFRHHIAPIVLICSPLHKLCIRSPLPLHRSLQYVSPYDDPLLWEGHSTLVDELAASGIRPGAIVASVGGGGLLCGLYQGLKRHGWHDVRLRFALNARRHHDRKPS